MPAARWVCLLVFGFGLEAPAFSQSAEPVSADALGKALHDLSGAQAEAGCRSSGPQEVLVCGRAARQYRIDPVVLATERRHEALPSKPPLAPDAAPDNSCVGPRHCGDAVIPLVGVALAAAKAAVLASQGDDWRDAFRTRADAYATYEEEKAKPHISIGVQARTAGRR